MINTDLNNKSLPRRVHGILFQMPQSSQRPNMKNEAFEKRTLHSIWPGFSPYHHTTKLSIARGRITLCCLWSLTENNACTYLYICGEITS